MVKGLICEFSIVPKLIPPISIHTDSISTNELLKQVNIDKKLN